MRPVFALLLALEPGLQWHAPEGCPTRDEAAAYLEGELHIDPETESAEVWVESTETGWRAEVAIDGGPPRALNATSCGDVMAAAMVVIAVARDAEPETFVPEPEPAPEPEPEPPPEPTPTREPEPRREPAPSSPPPEPARAPLGLTHWLGVHAGPSAVALPVLTARVGLRYELGADAWALRLAAHYETPRTLRYDGADVGGTFQAASADLAGCWVPGRGAVRGALCGGLSAGGVFGEGVGVPVPLRPRGAWLAGHATAGLRWAFTPKWGLAIDGLLTVGLVRPAFHVGDRDDLFKSPLLGGAGTVGIERRLP